MLTTLTALTLVSVAQGTATDTTVAVPAGASLNVNNFGGEIAIHVWTQNRVRVRADHGSRDRIEVSLLGNILSIKASSRRGTPSAVDFDITVPPTMGLNLAGTYTEISVDGVKAPISAETVQGEVTVRGGDGVVSLKSVEGQVTLADAKGRIEVNAINESIELSNVSGSIIAETVNGDVTLRGITSASVEATTVNGDVEYEGTISDGGTYRFSSNNGDVTVSVPERANVAVSASTVNGEFNSSFPVSLVGSSKHRFHFTIGSGSARMEIETFSGDVELRRPDEMRARNRQKNDWHKNKDRDPDPKPDH